MWRFPWSCLRLEPPWGCCISICHDTMSRIFETHVANLKSSGRREDEAIWEGLCIISGSRFLKEWVTENVCILLYLTEAMKGLITHDMLLHGSWWLLQIRFSLEADEDIWHQVSPFFIQHGIELKFRQLCRISMNFWQLICFQLRLLDGVFLIFWERKQSYVLPWSESCWKEIAERYDKIEEMKAQGKNIASWEKRTDVSPSKFQNSKKTFMATQVAICFHSVCAQWHNTSKQTLS